MKYTVVIVVIALTIFTGCINRNKKEVIDNSTVNLYNEYGSTK